MRNKRILKNTLVLYARQILTLLVSLYTVRVVLDVLGIDDYGIYTVVTGIVTLSSFLPGSMASATQRFFSFALGQNDHEKLKKTFSVNLMLYAAIALVALLILESLGLWFVNEHLKIPPERFASAQTLYHLSIMSFIVGVFSSPFMAIMTAHEDMHIYAYMSIFDVVMKLAVVFLLTYIPWDKLEIYGYLLLFVSVINTGIYILICQRKYAECQFREFYWDKALMREIIGFTGWTLFGQVSTVARHQAVTILINQMFNPATVAARAIAMNVAGKVSMFSINFNTGLYPPIIKSYAANEKQEMFSLIFNGSKLTFFMMWVFALPMLIEMEVVLNLWLKDPPKEAVFFTQLALIESLIFSISLPIATAARAAGKMKFYELVLGSIQIGIFIVSWIVLNMGYPAYSVFVVAIVANLLMFMFRLLIVRWLIDLPLRAFLRQVVFPVFGVVTLSAFPSLAIYRYVPNGLLYSGLMVLICLVLASVSMYFVGLDKYWRKKIRLAAISSLVRLKGVS